ncbi:MAG: hypothetical protein HQ402_02215 [Parcubacteria group bacterium]|nr:hypothetical protein [Parcubacteria group bacterium]
MIEIEFEKTYLAKKMPEGLENFPHKEIIDIYIPQEETHPFLRIRKKGDVYEITKKEPINRTDSSEQSEHTIKLREEEFRALVSVKGKRVNKIRYNYNYSGRNAEIGVFQEDLAGLVLVDFEFEKVEDKNNFKMPDFCLVDITQDKTFAGGMLCGKKYADIEPRLKELGYKKIDN